MGWFAPHGPASAGWPRRDTCIGSQVVRSL